MPSPTNHRVEYRLVKSSNGLDHYETYHIFSDNTEKKIATGNFVKSHINRWWMKPYIEVLKEIGIETIAERANSIYHMFGEDIEIIYYLSAMGSNGDEAMKLILGPVTTELNNRHLNSENMRELIPSYVMRNFLDSKDSNVFDKSSSKPIFERILSKTWPKYPDDDTMKELNDIMTSDEFKSLDDDKIESILDKIISDNPGQVDKARETPKLKQWFIGQVMKATQGKSNPQLVSQMLDTKI